MEMLSGRLRLRRRHDAAGFVRAGAALHPAGLSGFARSNSALRVRCCFASGPRHGTSSLKDLHAHSSSVIWISSAATTSTSCRNAFLGPQAPGVRGHALATLRRRLLLLSPGADRFAREELPSGLLRRAASCSRSRADARDFFCLGFNSALFHLVETAGAAPSRSTFLEEVRLAGNPPTLYVERPRPGAP